MNKYLVSAALAAVMTLPLSARADDQFGLNITPDGISLNYASAATADPTSTPEDRWQRGRAAPDTAQAQPSSDESWRDHRRDRHDFREEERRRHEARDDRRWEGRHDRDGWRDHARRDGFRPEGMARENRGWQPRHQLASAPGGFAPQRHLSQAVHQGASPRLPTVMRSHQGGQSAPSSHHAAGTTHRHQS